MNGHVRKRTSAATGKTTYQIVVYLARDPATGKPIYGPCPVFKTRTAAQTALHDLMVELKGGSAYQRGSGAVTVADVWRAYLRDEAPGRLRPKTLQSYREAMVAQVLPSLGRLPIDKLTAPSIERLKGELTAAGLAPSSVRNYLAPLRATCAWAVKVGHLRRDPCKAVRNPTVRPTEQPVLDADGIAAAIEAARGTQLEYGVLISGVTGLRIGEVAALRWGDVDLKSGRLRVTRTVSQARTVDAVFGPPKGGRARTVTLPAFVCGELAAERLRRHGSRADDLVCECRRGGPLRPKNASVQLARIFARHDLPDRRPWHTLRHSVLTLLADHMTPRDLQEWAGHSNVKTTLAYYVHATEAAQVRGASVMEEALSSSGDRVNADSPKVVALKSRNRA